MELGLGDGAGPIACVGRGAGDGTGAGVEATEAIRSGEDDSGAGTGRTEGGWIEGAGELEDGSTGGVEELAVVDDDGAWVYASPLYTCTLIT